MSKIIYKFFAGWDYEKEENWLNMMSAKGKQLISVGICRYEFEDGEPNKYTYRYELLKNPSDHPESLEYIRFVEETGAEHIGSVEGWAYFRKETSAGEFNLFSDPSSIASYNMRMLRMVLGVGATQVILAFVLSALIAWIMGGWFFVSTFLAAIFLGFAVLCAFGAFRIKMKLSRLKNDFGVQAGMADFYGQTSVFTFGAGAKRVVVSIIGMLVWLYLYIFLHEAGHALVAIMYGNTIESFVVFGRWPHVSLGLPYYFTDFGLGLFLAGGVILPMLCGAVAIAFYRPGVRHFWYHEFIYRTADILPFITLIVWAGFPIMSLFATPPPWEDVTRFINVTGIHPLVVAA
ncbi:MAG: DUF2812 domain-containing protein, partial [Defluviitaleaceae bacterium]|nr:DUF2812 domain-containing protein [Defluviitaleaceae bacterium]